jgi:3-phenylpropionate/trans-cinnamate dioxygenase ferredoxin subunit
MSETGSAGAGKWTKVAKASAVGKGEMTGASVGETELAVYNIDGKFFATDNICTHEFALLSDGTLEGAEVVCPYHQARFDVRDGKVKAAPACKDLRTFPVRVSDDDIEAQVP